jgi:enterochelin esterase family protein
MDNLIAEGRAVPFIVVTNENMPKLPSDGTHGMEGYESLLLNDCIPFIEGEYRVKKDKWSRAIAGNSYGCMVTSFVGFRHPERFGALGLLSGGIRCKDIWPAFEQNHHLDWLKGNAAAVGAAYRLIYRCHGTVELHDSPDHVQDDAFLKENGISDLPCYVREFFPGGRHEWDTFGKDFAGFAARAFKEVR